MATILTLSKSDLEQLIDGIIAEQKVYGIQQKGEKYNFAELNAAKDLTLDYDVSLQSPKKFFLPACESLLSFDGECKYKSDFDTEKFVLVGVHPYDMIAVNQMDILFEQDNRDNHYFARRDNAVIIALDVVNPSKNVFATSMKTATVESGFDVILTDLGDGNFVAESITDAGDELLAKAGGSKPSDADLEKRKQIRHHNTDHLNKHKLECKLSDLPKLLDKSYDHPVWKEMSEKCFRCGSCNLVCPTCYCFDVQDEVEWDLTAGKRNRSWDGCMLDGFTKVAGEHEFRKSRSHRFRHRLYRKAKYVPQKIGGQIACVGCGRCVDACLPNIANPINVYNELADELKVD